MVSMTEITENGNQIEKLENLLLMLAESIDTCADVKSMAQLARQYRETLKELELIGESKDDDEISRILQDRCTNGKSKSVRKSNA